MRESNVLARVYDARVQFGSPACAIDTTATQPSKAAKQIDFMFFLQHGSAVEWGNRH
jgi:hypothetical protein